jgi:hypothetical protein
MPPDEELTLDTQEETTEELDETTDETEEVEEVADQDDDQEEEDEESEGIPDDAFGDEDESDNSNEPLGDLKALVKDNPEALARASQVEAGLIKLQNQKAELETYALPMSSFVKGVNEGDVESLKVWDDALHEKTGVRLRDILTFMGEEAKTGGQSVDNSKLTNIEKKLEALETERAATKWITETGAVVASQVARETGLEFSPELLWLARPYLQKGAKVEDVRKAVMRVDPDAYDRAVALRDGGKKPVPIGAKLPSGKTGSKRTFEHTSSGFLAARAAREAALGKGK